MWLIPALTLGVVSVGSFVQGALIAMATMTDPYEDHSTPWFPVLLMLIGAVGMWLTVRWTPER